MRILRPVLSAVLVAALVIMLVPSAALAAPYSGGAVKHLRGRPTLNRAAYKAALEVAGLTRSTSSAPPVVRDDGPEYVKDIIVLGLKPAKSGVSVRTAIGEAKGRVTSTALAGRDMVVKLPAGTDGSALLARLRLDPDIRFAQFDTRVHMDYAMNDTWVHEQYGLFNIRAPYGWNWNVSGNKGSSGVKVAVIDTGVDLDHPDLVGHIDLVNQHDFINNDSVAQDDQGHGTHVAGIIGASGDDSMGTVGVAPGVTILPIKVLGSDGYSVGSSVADGIYWAADASRGVDIINMSLGGGAFNQYTADAVALAVSHNIAVFSSMGNNGTYKPAPPDPSAYYPASYDGVYGVGSVDVTDARSSFSNWGPACDLTAPGTNILSTVNPECDYTGDGVPDGWGWAWLSGTSMSCPMAAGSTALVLSQMRATVPSKTGHDAAEQVVATCDDLGSAGRDDYFGAGRVNLDKAITAVPESSTRPIVQQGLGGASRYETAVLISQRTYESDAPAIVIARGTDFPDALGGAALAGSLDEGYGGPILLVPTSGTLPAVVAAEITRLQPSSAYILGGTGAVSDSMKNQVKALLTGAKTVTRLGGASRYQTARLIAKKVRDLWNADIGGYSYGAVVCNGTTWPDALLAGPMSSWYGLPILLTRSTFLDADTTNCIKYDLTPGWIVVVGNRTNISTSVFNAIGGLQSGDEVTAVGATTTNAQSMSVAVAEFVEHDAHFQPESGPPNRFSWNKVAISTAANYPDALAGGIMQANHASMILLTSPTTLDTVVRDALIAHKSQMTGPIDVAAQPNCDDSSQAEVRFLGGTLAVTQPVRDAVIRALQ